MRRPKSFGMLGGEMASNHIASAAGKMVWSAASAKHHTNLEEARRAIRQHGLLGPSWAASYRTRNEPNKHPKSGHFFSEGYSLAATH